MKNSKIWQFDSKGLIFSANDLSPEQLDVMLSFAEEGIVNETDNNFYMPWDSAVSLEKDIKSFFELPSMFDGKIYVNFKSFTYDKNFRLEWGLFHNKREIYPSITGALIEFDGQVYMMDKILFDVVTAIREHYKSNHTEEDNLFLIYYLKEAVKNGLNIDLRQFNNFEFVVPDKISLFIEADAEGNLLLTPNFGINEDPSEIRKRLHQVHKNAKGASLRAKNRIVILDENKRKAIEEVIKTRKIDKSERDNFIKNPSAYIDDSLIDLENGFSTRVVGLTEFVQAYFGDQEKSINSWFDICGDVSEKIIHKIPHIKEIIKNEDELEDFERIYQNALQNNTDTVSFKDKYFDISNDEEVKTVIKECRENFGLNGEDNSENLRKLVFDIKKNDELLDFQTDFIEKDNFYQGEIDNSEYSRKFYSHQSIGIRWILSHAVSSIKGSPQGCLLADDMGLGKTFMTLVAIREYQKLYQKEHNTNKPVLIVAPVSLIENWKQEIENSYQKQFFDKVIMLTAEADLKKYQKDNSTKELVFNDNDDIQGLSDVRYALKIGEQYGKDRLDAPNNIIIANYETLRSYQASFALVDWSFIVFDEIQYLKNPNTRVSVAAKALKSNFKLAVTGTPVENSLKDIWNIFDVVNSGLLYEYQKFREEFISPILNADPNTKVAIGKKLRDLIGNNMLRRNKEDCLSDLTKKIIYSGCKQNNQEIIFNDKLVLPMNEKQEEIYSNILYEYNNAPSKKGIALSTLKSLRVTSLCPELLDGNKELPVPQTIKDVYNIFSSSPKLEYVIEQLNEIRNKKEKVIIFAINKKLQELLRRSLNILYNLNVRIINGDTKTVSESIQNPSRKRIINEFSNKDGFNVIIISPIAAGVGLTVTAANNVIHLERHWNPAKEAQATDRVYRIGQKKDVNIYVPICTYSKGKSFDEILDTLLSRKIDLNKSIVTPNEFSEEDIAAVTNIIN